MKSLKIILCTVLIFALCLSLASCTFGGLIDKDGNVKIKDKDGEINIGKSKWDKSKMHGLTAPKAKLDSSISTKEGTTYFYTELKESEFKKFIEQAIDAGFTYNVYQSDYSYSAANKDGEIIGFLYDSDSKSGTISSSKGEKPDEDDKDEDIVIGKKWDSNKMQGLPDPGVKVISYTSLNDMVAYTLEPFEDYTEYLDVIKAHGFDQDDYEMEVDDGYLYSASNGEGYAVIFSVSAEATLVSIQNNNGN